MKRFSTAFLLLILAAAFTNQSFAQVARRISEPSKPAISQMPTVAVPGSLVQPGSSHSEEPLATVSKSVSYVSDTSNNNWYVYMPLLNTDQDTSVGFYQTTLTNYGTYADFVKGISMGPLDVNIGHDTTFESDTTFDRGVALRVSTPPGLKPNSTKYIDSIQVALFPFQMSDRDTIVVRVVQMKDALTRAGNTLPFPDYFGANLATGYILPSQLTGGEPNVVTVDFKHKNISTRSQVGIMLMISGPDFTTDSIGFIFDKNLQDQVTVNSIDTDGSMFVVVDGAGNGIPMRTYKINVDNGNLMAGSTPLGPVAGSSFLVGFQEIAEGGTATGQAMYGNLAITTFMTGTASAGVNDDLAANSLGEMYPNPVTSRADISYMLEKNGPVSLKLYNSLGNEAGTIIDGVQGTGRHDVTVDVSKLANGMYFYKLQAGDFTATRTMVVAK